MRIIFLYIILVFSHSFFAQKKLKPGVYRGVLFLDEQENIELPFNFELTYKKRKPVMVIHNAEEKIMADEIQIRGDSVFIRMPVFDTEFRCVKKGNGLEGIWINHYRKEKNILRFTAAYGEKRRFLADPARPDPVFAGKWEVTFSPGTAGSSKAIGMFEHLEQSDFIRGTFLTETGDYRYLEGMRNGDKLYLSCFDGSHAFLFHARLREGRLSGTFYSGAHWREPWIAVRNDTFSLKDPETITHLKDPAQIFQFSYKDLNGRTVTLSGKEFANRPVIIQLMGSWCPNCMDETVYLTELYSSYNKQGLQIVAIAFEKTSDPIKAKEQVSRMVKKLAIPYPVLLSYQSGKDKATEAFPILNRVSAFPTTIFLNRQHRVVKIHTGFSGPATGNEYLSFKERTESLIRQLIRE